MRATTPTLVLAAVLAASACKTVAEDAAAGPDPLSEPATLQAAEVGTIRNLHTFGDIWLAGQPGAEDFALVEDAGIATVINLRKTDEPVGFDVAACVADNDMLYANPAFRSPDELTDELFGELRELLREAPRPLLLHCGSANRVGAVWIPWRVLDKGVELEQAVAEAKEIGLRSPEYEAKARDYVARQGG